MKRYEKIAVLMGGASAEREVSLRSGRAVARGLRKAGYTVSEVDVKTRRLAIPRGTDAVFIALHGEFGEDGEVQERLNLKGMPYTGSGANASRVAFDKIATKRVFSDNAIPTPDYQVLRKGGRRKLDFPLVTKPPRQGSSIGMRCVKAASQWRSALKEARRYGSEVLVEAYIEGRELTVGVLGDDVLEVVEIVAPNAWYDYFAKYTNGICSYEAPARLEKAQRRHVQKIALRAYHAQGCRGFGRIDFRISSCDEAFVLEVNTIPGFTETSLLPKSAAACNIGFSELCARIMERATTD